MAKINIEYTGLQEAIKGLKNVAEVPNSVIHRIAAQAVLASTQMRFRYGKDPSGKDWPMSRRVDAMTKGQTLKDTGRLLGSLYARWDNEKGQVGTNVVYAAIHQFGGTIVPKKAKALAIPLSKEAHQAGRPKLFPRKLGLFWPEGSDHGFLVEHQKAEGKKSARAIFHYILKKKVVIPARPFLGVSNQNKSEIVARIKAYIQAKFTGQQGGQHGVL